MAPLRCLLFAEDCAEIAQAWADRLGLEARPLGERRSTLEALLPDHEAVLVCDRQGLALQALEKPLPGPVRVDLAEGTLGWRLSPVRVRAEMVAKACGLKQRMEAPLRIVDATAGLARDACVLAAAGAHVLAAERSPVIAALLEDGFRRARAHPELAELLSRLEFRAGDSRALLAGLAGRADRPDVVYLDPMFPHRDKSALVKKEMRVFRAVVGADDDADGLLPLAMAAARRRVVVKRPRLAPALAGLKPTLVMEGRSGRFDIYLP